MLWTHAQCPANRVHVVADVHTLDINSARGGREQSSQNRSDKHQSRIIIDYISSLTSNVTANFKFHLFLNYFRTYNSQSLINANCLHGGGFPSTVMSQE